ncbi:MAG: hypothetical protein JAZ13_07715 [Candidatus Thiodiazotropha taylori]|nr:hypothetical protein [Candidatus Thiodiazotropha taylori]
MRFLHEVSIKLALLTVIVIILLCLLSVIDFFLSQNTTTDSVSLATFLPSIVIGCGVVIAIFTYTSAEERRAEDRKRHQSQVIFNEAKHGLSQVIELLKDSNNDYVTWSQVASIIRDYDYLKRKVLTNEFKHTLDIFEKHTISTLQKVLTAPVHNSSIRKSLPPTFFYGLHDWKTFSSNNSPFAFLEDSKDYTKDLHLAATIATGHSSTAFHGEYTVLSDLPNTDISPSVVLIIYSFIAGIDFSNKSNEELFAEWNSNRVIRMPLYQGAILYIKHRSNYKAIDGGLYDRSNKEVFRLN